MRIGEGPYEISIVAAADERFADFQPYVASINDGGVVAFQARLRDRGSGVWAASGETIRSVVETQDGPLAEIASHPDIAGDGSVSFYASRKDGGRGVFLVREGEPITIAASHGPLGPTVEEGGAIGFRAETSAGMSAIFRTVDGETRAVATAAEPFIAFEGLPVINARYAVAFRADLTEGRQGIYVAGDDGQTTVVETGARFGELGKFPTLLDDGTVAFTAKLRRGGEGVFAKRDGAVETIVASGDSPFRSFRGVLVSASGFGVFYGTPGGAGARLGIYSGPDPVADRLLAIGSPLLGSTVADFALNPVSINRHGQLAIRVLLTDDRQLILRADPRPETAQVLLRSFGASPCRAGNAARSGASTLRVRW